MSAHPSIIDVSVSSPTPGIVQIHPLAKSGSPSDEVLSNVELILTDDKIRPLTDKVVVNSPEKIDFEIEADIYLFTSADYDSIIGEISSRIDKYIEELKSKLGKDIVPSQIIAILNIQGVFKVDLIKPQFVEISHYQWANCAGFKTNFKGYTNG